MAEFDEVRAAWAKYAAEVTITEIKTTDEAPSQDNYPKNAIYIGILRGEWRDQVIIVKLSQYIHVQLDRRFEAIPLADYARIGMLPRENQTCSVCEEFSTAIYRDGRCHDCTRKNVFKITDGRITATIWPNTGESGTLMMPLVRNVPDGHPGWEKTTCPACGNECWERPEQKELMKRPGMVAACTECALRAMTGGSSHAAR